MLLLCLFIAAMPAGCGRDKGNKEDGADKDVKLKSPEVKPRVIKTDLPHGFPADLPIYPGSEVTFAPSGKDQYRVTFRCRAAADAVVLFFEEQLDAKNWKILNRENMGEITNLVVQKAETHCGISINGSDSSTTIVMNVTRDKAFLPEDKKPKEVAKETRPLMGGVPIPNDFPADFVLYPAGKVRAIVNEPDFRSITFTTTDRAEKATVYLEVNAKKLGWKQFQKKIEDEKTILGLEKEDRLMTITIHHDEIEPLIQIGVIAKKEKK